jgi:hypothetical protein
MELNFQANDFDRVKVVLQSVARDADYSYSDFSSSKENSVTVNIQLKNIDGVVVAIFGIIDEGDLREPLAIAIDCQGECSSWKKVASSLRERLSMYWDVNNVETDR